MVLTARRLAIAGATAGLITALAFAQAPIAHAATTITVPGMQPTIQAAINAASPGDTVVVSPGTYTENINFNGKAITVQSSQGAATTIIDGGGAGPVATFATGEARSSVLQGFTLRNGTTPAADSYEGGGVHISSASPSILNNVVSGNGGCSGVGISVAFASPLIQGNTIANNAQNTCSGGQGGGIYVRGAASAQIVSNTITSNHADSGGGIALFAAGTPTIENNVVENNSAGQGGGLYAVNQSDAAVVQNIFATNSATTGAGLYISPPSGTQGATLTNDTVAGNTGAGLWVGGFDSSIVISNTLFVAPSGDAAVQCDTSYNATAPSFITDDLFNGGSPAYAGPCLSNPGSSGNAAVDPQFVNASSGNYHVNAASPVINAGTNSASGMPTTDLDGNARIIGGVVDLGVYEVNAPPGAVTNLHATRSKATITVSWSPPAPFNGTPVTSYRVTASPGGTQTVSASTLSVTYQNVSKHTAYTFTVVAINAAGAGPSASVTVAA